MKSGPEVSGKRQLTAPGHIYKSCEKIKDDEPTARSQQPAAIGSKQLSADGRIR